MDNFIFFEVNGMDNMLLALLFDKKKDNVSFVLVDNMSSTIPNNLAAMVAGKMRFLFF